MGKKMSPGDADFSAAATFAQWMDSGADETLTLPRHTLTEGGEDTQSSSDDRNRALLASLPPVELAETDDGKAQLCRLGLLGRGGMADVYLASQTALRRTVAVKVLKPGEERLEAAGELVREARITGALEHPNIVPVHSLGVDAAGRPLLVMKRIEGDLWFDLLDPERPLPERAGEDRLQFHIEILTQVCNAVHFAHSHGIVHRDLKPNNVMVGRFGEVYLLDWGIAVEVDSVPWEDEGEGGDRVVGSPAYMAPEMLSGLSRHIGPRTDVYLLGATLHRVITGQPRHRGNTPTELYQSILTSAPVEYGPDVPEELARIVNRATHRDTTQRYESAEALRRALAAFLLHRSSISLSAEASRRLDEVRRAMSGLGPPMEDVEMHRRMGECSFGFRQALSTWPANQAARQGLRDTLEMTVEQELIRENARAARVILQEIEAPPERLLIWLAEVEAELKAREARLASLERFQEDLNLDVSRNARSLFAMGVAFAAFVGPVSLALADRFRVLPFTWPVSLISAMTFLVLTSGLFWTLRFGLLRNKANRRLAAAVAVSLLAFTINRARGLVMGLSPHEAVAGDALVFAVVAATVGVTLDARVWWAVPVYVTASFSAAWKPHLSLELTGIANLLGIGLIAFSWWERPGQRAARVSEAGLDEDEDALA